MPRSDFGEPLHAPTRGINPLNLVGNGRLATGISAGALALYINQISACRRRVIAQWHRRPLMTGVAGDSTWTDIAYFRVRPSYQSVRIRAVIVAAPSSNTSAAGLPALQFARQDMDGPGLLNFYNIIHVGRRDTGTIVPDDMFVLSQVLGPETNTSGTDEMVPGRSYDLKLRGRGGVRVYSVTLFEESGPLYKDDPAGVRGSVSCDFTFNGPYTQIEDPAGNFNASDIGAEIVITGATTGANDGSYRIFRVTNSTTIEYHNTAGVTQAFGANTRYRLRSPSILGVGHTGAPIVDDDIERMLQIPYNIWLDGGGHLFEWSDVINPPTRTSATYANIHDQTTSAWTAGTFGHWTWPYKCGTFESTNVPVTLWVHAAMAGGGTGGVRFVKNGSTIGTVSVTGGTAIYTATANLDSTQTEEKIDVMLAGDGANLLTVYGFGMVQTS